MASKDTPTSIHKDADVFTTKSGDLSSANVPLSGETPLNPVDLRGQFALALCRAHRIGMEDGSTPCQDGLACIKKDACLEMADKTLSYARDLTHERALNTPD